MASFAIATIIRAEGKGCSRLLLSGLFNTIFHGISLAQNAMTMQSCLALEQKVALWSVAAILSTSLSILASIALVLGGSAGIGLAAIFTVASGMALQVHGIFYSATIMNPYKLGLYSVQDKIDLSASMAASLPILIIMSVMGVVSCFTSRAGWLLMIMLWASAVLWFFHACIFVGMGKIMGDAWG